MCSFSSTPNGWMISIGVTVTLLVFLVVSIFYENDNSIVL
jgi:hypothetical protein